MGYRINYTGKGTRKKVYKYISLSPAFAFAVLIILILSVSFFTVSNDLEHTMYMLFPWNEPSIETAFSKLELSIQQGIPILDAITAFYKEIVSEAAI